MQNYASKDLSVIDERFYTESVTQEIINNGIKITFEGVNSVTIYNIDVVPEVDYQRNGANRFGPLVELGTGVQTFVLSQDKAFTFTVDRGNLEDSMLVQEADRAVKRQVREVSIPTTDIYRLSVLTSYAIANSQGDTGAITNTNAYQKVLAQQEILDDAEVPTEGRYMFVTSTFYNLLKRDPEFVKDCDTSVRDLKKGILGEVDGLTIKKAPKSYYVANFAFMIVHKKVLIAPTKFNMIRVLDTVQGIDGKVAEGRRYYDAFIPKNKGKAIRVHRTA